MSKFNHREAVHIVVNNLERFGLNVLYTEEKGLDIDILAVLPNETTIKIVVRTVSPNSQYSFIEQRRFDINDNCLFIAALYLKSANEYEIYLLPAVSWLNNDTIFKTYMYDKPGLLSEPEYGITFSLKTTEKIQEYKLPIILYRLNEKLKSEKIQ